MDKNSKIILKYLKKHKEKDIFRNELDRLIKNPKLAQNIIEQLIRAKLIHHDNNTGKIMIELKGENQLEQETIFGWIKRNLKHIISLR